MLAVGQPGTALADRLSPAVAKQLIDQALELADYVVIDSPPLTDVSDALPLAALADEVLVVARMGVSKLGKLARLQDMLANQGIRASGFVLVGEGARRPGYYYAPTETRGLAPVRRDEVPGERRREAPADSEESVGTRRP